MTKLEVNNDAAYEKKSPWELKAADLAVIRADEEAKVTHPHLEQIFEMLCLRFKKGTAKYVTAAMLKHHFAEILGSKQICHADIEAYMSYFADKLQWFTGCYAAFHDDEPVNLDAKPTEDEPVWSDDAGRFFSPSDVYVYYSATPRFNSILTASEVIKIELLAPPEVSASMAVEAFECSICTRTKSDFTLAIFNLESGTVGVHPLFSEETPA